VNGHVHDFATLLLVKEQLVSIASNSG